MVRAEQNSGECRKWKNSKVSVVQRKTGKASLRRHLSLAIYEERTLQARAVSSAVSEAAAY